MNLSIQKEDQKDREPTPHSFQRLLNWLDQGQNSDGQSYLDMRRRLLAYFDRKNSPEPEDLVDEVLNRVARRLEEEEIQESDAPARYCYIVARFVFMEHLRAKQKNGVVLDEMKRQVRSEATPAERLEEKERVLNCLERCTDKLAPSSRELITCYYVGRERAKIENRRALAESLGITMNALAIRACRIRDKLEACVRECMAAAK